MIRKLDVFLKPLSRKFLGQEGMMSVDTHAPLSLSFAEVENLRTTKHTQILGLKVTYGESIERIKECELHRLEAMVMIPCSSEP